MTSTQPSWHWSKDFVEHLRGVHFALLTVSVGLILLLMSRTYDVKVAEIQLEELLSLKSWWAPNGLTSPPGQRLASSIEEMRYTGAGSALTSKPITLPDMFVGVLDDGNAKTNINFTLPQVNWYWCRAATKSQPSFEDSKAPREFPNSLRGLPQWWKTLDNTYFVNRVVDMFPAGDARSPLRDGSSKPLGLTISQVGTGYSGNPTVHLSLTNPCASRDSYLSATDERGYVFAFRVGHLESVEIDQESLSKRFHDLTPGRFQETFSDLVEATRGREDLDLGFLLQKLSEEAAKGGEVFEVFGLKLPAGQVSTWGFIVLIGVQFYLFLYLRRLRNNLGPDDPGWDVPWIAMDQSRLARLATFLSFVILPVVAAALASWQWVKIPLSRLLAEGPTRLELRVLGSSFAVAVSLALGFKCWHFRPRMKDRAPSAQLFE